MNMKDSLLLILNRIAKTEMAFLWGPCHNVYNFGNNIP